MADLPDLPNQIENGDIPDADLVMENFEHIRSYLNGGGFAPSDLAAGSDGRILVADASGVLQYRSMSGDATTSNTGVVTVNQQQAAADTTERTTTSSSFVLLTGAPQKSITFGADGGIIWVLYRALWKLVGSSGGTAEAHAAIHIAGSALAHAIISHGEDEYGKLFTSPFTTGISTGTGYSGLNTSGQTTSAQSYSLPAIHGLIEPAYAPDMIGYWGRVPIEVGAGTHTVDVRFKLGGSDGGTVHVDEQKLFVSGEAF